MKEKLEVVLWGHPDNYYVGMRFHDGPLTFWQRVWRWVARQNYRVTCVSLVDDRPWSASYEVMLTLERCR